MKNQSGQTLVEVLVALGIAVILLSGLTLAVLSALSNTTFSRNQNLATQYGQEAIEQMRTMRDSNYATFSQLSGTYCFAKTCSSVTTTAGICGTQTNCAKNIDNFFQRRIIITRNDGTCGGATKVQADVLWTDGGCPAGNPLCKKVDIISCFTGTVVAPTL